MSSARVEAKIEKERIRLLYELAPGALIALFFTCGAVASFFWFQNPESNRGSIALWFVAIVVMLLLRMKLWMIFKRASESDFDARFWALLFTLGAGVSGFLVGISPVLFLDFSNTTAVVFLTIIVVGTLAGSLGVLAHFRFAYFLFSTLSTLPLMMLFFLQGGSMAMISLLMLIFLSANFFYANSLYKMVTHSIEQRFENLELMERLKHQTGVAEKANIDKSRLLAATSHDLRQPLHSLGLFLAVLKEKLTTEEQMGLMTQTEQSQKVLNDQLNAVIEITQIDAGELHVELRSISSKVMVEGVVGEFSLLAKRANIEIRTLLADAWIDTDPIIFTRILRNLISNAIQHCPDSTLLIASRVRDGASLELSVIDDGPGIAQSETQNVFSEFYQLNNPERDRNKGIGLGLSIVKRLSLILGAPVELQSKLGCGSTFRLVFPVSLDGYQQQIAQQEEFSSEVNSEVVSGLFILLVDDDVRNLEAMKRLLLHWGAEVLTATSLESVLGEFESFPYPKPDLMLVDYRLKEEKTGYELIEQMRHYFGYSVPAALITGDATLNLKSEFMDQDILVEYKPIQSGNLIRLIDELLKGSAGSEQ